MAKRSAAAGKLLPLTLALLALRAAAAHPPAATAAAAAGAAPAAAARPRAAPCLNASNPHFDCPAPCFCNATWNAADVLSTDGLLFSPKYNLRLHMFEPPASDTRAQRPAMVMIHGGGFKGGNRNDKKGIIEWSTQLAARGYVAVSIDYRINQTEAHDDMETSMVWAAHDAKARAPRSSSN